MGTHCGIGDVPKVPRHKKINTTRDGDGDMRRILRGPAGNGALIDQRLREILGIWGGIKKRDRLQDCEPDLSGLGIARSSFRNDQC